MDTSEIYIKMSEKSPLQELWQPAHGDYYWGYDSIYEPDLPECFTDRRFWGVHLLADFDSASGAHHLEPEHFDKSRHFCLFRQDQLQEMVGCTACNLGWFYRWASSEVYDLPNDAENFVFTDHWYRWIPKYFNCSWEQLWHAFVVQEKYNKVWDGEDWKNV